METVYRQGHVLRRRRPRSTKFFRHCLDCWSLAPAPRRPFDRALSCRECAYANRFAAQAAYLFASTSPSGVSIDESHGPVSVSPRGDRRYLSVAGLLVVPDVPR